MRMRRDQDSGLLVPDKRIVRARHERAGLCMASPQQALLMAKKGGTDPDFSSVVSLMHYEGTNGSTTFTDQIPGNSWSAQGDAQIATAQSQYGSASLSVDGTGDYISVPHDAKFNPGASDMTVEIAVRATSWTSGGSYIAALFSNFSGSSVWIMYYDTDTTRFGFDCRDSDGTTYRSIGVNVSGGISTGAWHSLAVSRVSDTFYFFVDGSSVGSQTLAFTMNNGNAPLTVGASNGYATNMFNGYLDEFRYTVGVGRYTSAYTPSGPFADD